MSRSVDFSVECSISVEQIRAALCEEDYWLARLAAYGGIGKLDSFAVAPDGSARVVVIHDVRNSLLPKPFAKLYPGDLEVVQRETWSLVGGRGVRGQAHIEARGAPGSGRSTVVMAPAPNGSHLLCHGIVEFKVPLVGGTIEGYFRRQMVDETPEMLRFTTKWVEEHT